MTIYPYLGKPGAMQQIVSGVSANYPNDALQQTPSRNDSAKRLLSAGTATSRTLNTKRQYVLSYQYMTPAAADIIEGFYEGLYGVGPFVLVNPVADNCLNLDVSTMGVRDGVTNGWVPSSGSIAEVTTGGPTGITSNVLNWTSIAASASLQPGSVANTADINRAPVYLPNEAVTASMWVKGSSSATMTLRVQGFNVDGSRNSLQSASQSISVTTSWQRFSCVCAAGALNSAIGFVLPWLLAGASFPTTVSIAGAQLEYASSVSTFRRGYGSPRVSFVQGTDLGTPLIGYYSSTATLAEV